MARTTEIVPYSASYHRAYWDAPISDGFYSMWNGCRHHESWMDNDHGDCTIQDGVPKFFPQTWILEEWNNMWRACIKRDKVVFSNYPEGDIWSCGIHLYLKSTYNQSPTVVYEIAADANMTDRAVWLNSVETTPLTSTLVDAGDEYGNGKIQEITLSSFYLGKIKNKEPIAFVCTCSFDIPFIDYAVDAYSGDNFSLEVMTGTREIRINT